MSVTLSQIHAELLRRDFSRFIRDAWPIVEPGKEFTYGWHVDAIAEHLMAVHQGQINQLIINIPPRFSKSTTVAVMWPAWAWTSWPSIQWLAASYALDLATRDNVKCRDLILSDWYMERFGDKVKIKGDQSEKTKFHNTKNGYRQSTSVGAQTTGHGGDILLLDDPHNTTEENSEVKIENAVHWYKNAFSNRLNDQKKGAIVVIMQRVSHKDLTGVLLKEGGWDHLMLPMEFEPHRRCSTSLGFKDPREKAGELLCPDRVGPVELVRMKKKMTRYAVASQLQQNPSPEEGGIIKKGDWRPWHGKLPEFDMFVQAYDTAFEPKEINDCSARTTWGIFQCLYRLEDPKGGMKEEWRYAAMLLERMNKRLEYPDLRAEAKRAHHDWKAETLLIEKKASGHSLIQELKRSGLPVHAWDPRNDSKVARANAASLAFEQGNIWYDANKPDLMEVIDQCANFPNDDHDDMVDTVTMFVLYARKRYFLSYAGEADDEDVAPAPKRRGYGS